MFNNPRWRSIESPHEWQKLLRASAKGHEKTIVIEDTAWNRRYREFMMTIICTKTFPKKFPTKSLLIAEGERRTQFLLASNPAHIKHEVLDDVLDSLLGLEWRTRNPPNDRNG